MPEHLVGVISDTHGLMRPEALRALGGVERILHAGDVGTREELDALQQIAPVPAVRGNTARDAWASRLPKTAVVEMGPATLYLLHDLGELDLDPAAAGFAAVIYGHSHPPPTASRGGVLYHTPGRAGPRRSRRPVTLARLRVRETGLEAEIVPLLPPA